MIMVTGAAGFVGFHVARTLLDQGEAVVGVDSLTDYYGTELKRLRLRELSSYDAYVNIELDLSLGDGLTELISRFHPDVVVHMAAQAGVQFSISHPEKYVASNIVAFGNLLEAMKTHGVQSLIFASSSSVYGESAQVPSRESDNVMTPLSVYAASKVANEAMAHAYSHLFGIRTIGLRFFTVYGPWGRPDMAYWKFYEKIRNGDSVDLYFGGNAKRAFTYIDDVASVVTAMATSSRPRQADGQMASVYNVGSPHPHSVLDLVRIIESITGKEAQLQMLPSRQGDVPWTAADTSKLERDWSYTPSTTLRQGMEHFANWYEVHIAGRG